MQGKDVKIGDLREGMRRVNVEGTIEEISETKEVRSRFTGEKLKVATAKLSDESGKIDLVLWNDQIELVALGDKVRIENGYVSSFRGTKQLNVGRYGKLLKV